MFALKDCDTYENVLAHYHPSVKIKLSDMVGMLKHNSAFVAGVVSDASDKLANEVASAAVVNTLVFGVLIGNYGFTGDISIYTTITSVVLIFFITGIAKKIGAGKAYLRYTWVATGVAIAMFLFFLMGEYTQVSVKLIPTVIFVVLYSMLTASKSTTNAAIVTMYQDIADYEFYLTGKYEPALVLIALRQLLVVQDGHRREDEHQAQHDAQEEQTAVRAVGAGVRGGSADGFPLRHAEHRRRSDIPRHGAGHSPAERVS